MGKSSKIMLSRERKPMFLSMMILEITDQVRKMTGVMTERETNTETMITERGIEMIIERGDMEHTHLVKGLDFALLQKVRAEIEAIETAKIDEEEEEVTIKEVSKKAEEAKAEKKDEEKPEEDKAISECRTTIGKNIYRLMFNPEIPKSNELFMPGRMAYVMDLEEDGETDIPTTSIRSKKDVVNSEQKATLSTNDIVINKLTQILSYLRAGNRTKRKKKDKIEDLLAE